MNTKTYASWLLSGLVVVTAILAVIAVANGSDQAKSSAEPTPSRILTPTPTPAVLPGAVDMARALTETSIAHPKQATVIYALVQGRPSAVVDAAPRETGPCESFITRGKTLCERQGYSSATVVDQIRLRSESLPGFAQERRPAENTIQYLTEGRSPTLDLLAVRGDEAILAVISIANGRALQFPGPLELGGPDENALYVIVSKDGVLLDLSTRTVGSPPLEPIQSATRLGKNEFQILAASQSFVERDRMWHQEDEASRKVPPPTR